MNNAFLLLFPQASEPSMNFRPDPHVSVFVWKRNLFSPSSKKFASTRSVFARPHVMRWIDLKTMTYPTAHANIARSGLELIMWPQRFRKVPFSHVHTYTRKHYKTAFSKSSTMESVFEKFRFDWSFSSDTCGRKPYPKRKSCVFKSKRISVDKALELVFLNRETDTKK